MYSREAFILIQSFSLQSKLLTKRQKAMLASQASKRGGATAGVKNEAVEARDPSPKLSYAASVAVSPPSSDAPRQVCTLFSAFRAGRRQSPIGTMPLCLITAEDTFLKSRVKSVVI